MIVKYFNQTKPINFIFLSVLLSIFTLISLYLKHFLTFNLNHIVGFFILIVSFFSFSFISKKRLTSSDKDFGILFYVLLSSLFYVPTEDNNTLISFFLIYFALNQLFNLKEKEVNFKKKLFNSSLIIGLTSVFYPLSVLFLGVVLVAVFSFNYISWRSIIIPFIGFIVPYFFMFILKDLFDILVFEYHFPIFSFSLPFVFQNTILSVVSGFILLLGLISFVIIVSKINTDFAFYKGFNSIVFSYLIISFIIIFFDKNKNGSELIFLILPFSVLLANAFSVIRNKWISNSVLFILIGFIVLNYFGG